MTAIASFIFNAFQENTYILYDHTKECVIIDPGCYTSEEQKELRDFILKMDLMPVKLLNTHCHIDHVLGNNYVVEAFQVPLEMNEQEEPLLEAAPVFGENYGIPMEKSPSPDNLLKEGNIVTFGETEVKVLFTPGHSPGHLTFYCEKEKLVISGDVLFLQSIGRTDLPGGDMDTLMNSIKTKLLPLNDDVKVYPGHGPETTIGFERKNNPFILEYIS